MNLMKSMSFAAAALASALSVSAAMAHSDEFLDTQAAPNGGQLRMAGIYHYELVVAKDSKETKDNPVMVYVTDHAGQKVATAGATGTATLLTGKLKSTATLQPDGDNRMKGIAKYASTPDMKGIVSLIFPGKPAVQARFTPLASNPAGEAMVHMKH